MAGMFAYSALEALGIIQKVLPEDESNATEGKTHANYDVVEDLPYQPIFSAPSQKYYLPSEPLPPPISYHKGAQRNSPIRPSPLVKAYAYTLRSHLTIQSNLSKADQAIFIANPMHLGIPIAVEEGYTNQAIYTKADAVQSDKTPEFRDGAGSFVDWLAEYIENVKEVCLTRAPSLLN